MSFWFGFLQGSDWVWNVSVRVLDYGFGFVLEFWFVFGVFGLFLAGWVPVIFLD